MTYTLNLNEIDSDGVERETGEAGAGDTREGAAPGGKEIAPDGPFDKPFTAAKVLTAVKGTGFIA